MEKMESPLTREKRVGDRKCRVDSDPDRIGVTGGDPKADDKEDQGDSDPDRFCVIVDDPNRIGVTGGDSKVDDRKDQGVSDSDHIGVAGSDQAFSCVTGGDYTSTERSRWKRAMISLTMLKDKITKILNL